MFNSTIQEVGAAQALNIINSRKPLGKFWRQELSTSEISFDDEWTFIGIDNSTGEAWVEEFKDKETMMSWLKGEFQIGDRK